jgi:hypothetical protein
MPPGLVLDRFGLLNLDLILGAITCDSGLAIDSREVLQFTIYSLVHSLFLDAFSWLVALKPKGAHWDDWLQSGRQLTSPIVWIALPAGVVARNAVEAFPPDHSREMLVWQTMREPTGLTVSKLAAIKKRALLA